MKPKFKVGDLVKAATSGGADALRMTNSENGNFLFHYSFVSPDNTLSTIGFRLVKVLPLRGGVVLGLVFVSKYYQIQYYQVMTPELETLIFRSTELALET